MPNLYKNMTFIVIYLVLLVRIQTFIITNNNVQLHHQNFEEIIRSFSTNNNQFNEKYIQTVKNKDQFTHKSVLKDDLISFNEYQSTKTKKYDGNVYGKHETLQNPRLLNVIQNIGQNNISQSIKPLNSQIFQQKQLPSQEAVSDYGFNQQNSQYNKNQITQQNIKGASLVNLLQTSTSNTLFQSIDYSKFLNFNYASALSNSQSTSQSTSQSNSSIKTNDFSQVELTHQIPETFLQGEIFLFYGKVINKQLSNLTDTRSISVVFLQQKSQRRVIFTQRLDLSQNNFKIQVQIPKSGTYKLFIFYGREGTPSSKVYTVLSNQLNLTNIKALSINLTLNSTYSAQLLVEKNDLFLKLSQKQIKNSFNITQSSTLKNNKTVHKIFILKFKQYFTQQITLIFSNFKDNKGEQNSRKIKIPYYKFNNYYEDLTQLEIYITQSQSQSAVRINPICQFINKLTFFATYHQFSQYKSDILQLNKEPPFYVKQRGFILNLTGLAKQQLRNEILVLQPNRAFKSYLINSFLKQGEKVNINSSLNLAFLIDKEGTYIIEINHADGYAALNQPVYIGDKIFPLLPDFQDMNSFQKDQDVVQIANIEKIKLYMLGLINDKRKQFGQKPLKLDQKINILAQNHADDMLKRGYINHYTPQGKAPTDRAKLLNIYEQISQNIALNKNIDDAHFRLCRSNIHLRNMVRPYWTRLGLGIQLNTQNEYIIVQEYSSRDLTLQPLTSKQISELKMQIMNTLIKISVSLKKINDNLSSDVEQYFQWKKLDQSSNYNNLGEYLRQKKNYIKWSYSNLQVTFKNQGFIQAIANQASILPTSDYYTQIGMSLQYKEGFIYMLFAFI